MECEDESILTSVMHTEDYQEDENIDYFNKLHEFERKSFVFEVNDVFDSMLDL